MSAPDLPGSATLRRIVELACRAPSVHNTQPWLWRIGAGRIDLLSDARRQLPVADSAGRNLVLSCGAALHHAQVAARSLALEAHVSRMPVSDDPGHLATIDLVPGRRTAGAMADLQALERRRTDRSRFTSWPMSDERLGALARSASSIGVHVTPVTDASDRFRLELLLSRAMARQRSDRRYAEEQGRWIDHSAVDGIPAAVVQADCGARTRPSRFASTSPVDGEDLVQGTDGLILIGTDADSRGSWLRAGEALSQVWLRATTDGLSVVPLSQVIEVEETRLALEHDLLGGMTAPQTLLRIGWQEIGRSSRPLTPRRPLDDVLTG